MGATCTRTCSKHVYRQPRKLAVIAGARGGIDTRRHHLRRAYYVDCRLEMLRRWRQGSSACCCRGHVFEGKGDWDKGVPRKNTSGYVR